MATPHDISEKRDEMTVDVQSNKAPTSTSGSNANQTPPPPHGTGKDAPLLNLRTFQDLVGIRTPAHILSTGSPHTSDSVHPSDLEKGNKNLMIGHGADTTVVYHAQGRPTISLKDWFFKSKVENEGIYGRAIDEALTASVYFNLSNWFINALYCAQIFIAAAITGLASYKGHEIPLTILGAMNAVLAGLMALLKGQGLPVRMRRSRDQFQNVMKTIENTERLFSRYVHMPDDYQKLHDPFKEFEACQSLFDAAKWDQQTSKSFYLFSGRNCRPELLLTVWVYCRLSRLVFEYA